MPWSDRRGRWPRLSECVDESVGEHPTVPEVEERELCEIDREHPVVADADHVAHPGEVLIVGVRVCGESDHLPLVAVRREAEEFRHRSVQEPERVRNEVLREDLDLVAIGLAIIPVWVSPLPSTTRTAAVSKGEWNTSFPACVRY